MRNRFNLGVGCLALVSGQALAQQTFLNWVLSCTRKCIPEKINGRPTSMREEATMYA